MEYQRCNRAASRMARLVALAITSAMAVLLLTPCQVASAFSGGVTATTSSRLLSSSLRLLPSSFGLRSPLSRTTTTSTALMYMPPSTPTSQTPPMVAQKIMSMPGSASSSKSSSANSQSSMSEVHRSGSGVDASASQRLMRSHHHHHHNKNVISLSKTALASCSDSYYPSSFPTARGLLSPETVMRMDEMTMQKTRSDAVTLFLDTYRRHGPMSCLPLLSDPEVLPHLTAALQDDIA